MTPRADTLIRNVRIFDGRGNTPTLGDVAITGDTLSQVADAGTAVIGSETREIDGTGLWLLPGLMDIHTHFDLEVELVPGLPEAVRHGTTSVLVANCSLGLAFGHLRDQGDDPIVDCFARVENMPKPLLKKIADKAIWRDSAEYLGHLASLPLGPSLAPLIPHSMLRIRVMGLGASVTRDPDASELAQMEALLEAAMQQGYAGFSTDALPFHFLANTPNQKKRIPGQYASFAELKRLTSVVRRHDRLWQATPAKDDKWLAFKSFLLTSARIYGKPLRVTAVAALDLASNRSIIKIARGMSRLFNSRLLGGAFRFQALAAPFKTWAEGPITPLAEEIPALRALNETELDDRAARLRIYDDFSWRNEFRAMWERGKRGFGLQRLKRLLRREDYAIRRDLSEMIIDRCPQSDWVGLSLKAVHERVLAWQRGALVSTSDGAVIRELITDGLDLAREADFLIAMLRHFDRELVWTLVSANTDSGLTRDLLFDPLLLPGFNDSGAHLTNMAFYDGNLRALKIAAEEGEHQIAVMVRRLTTEPAEFLGLKGEGLRLGARADMVLIDPKKLSAWQPEETVERINRDVFDGEEQLVNRPPGVVRAVWIGGHLAAENGEPTAALGEVGMGELLLATNHTPAAPETLEANPADPAPIAAE